MMFRFRLSPATASRAASTLAMALALAAGTLGASAAVATRLVRNVATVSQAPAGSRLTNSNEVTIEIATPSGVTSSQFAIAVSSSAPQITPGQEVKFSVRNENAGNTPAPASDPYILDGAPATGAFALTVVPAGSVLISVDNASLYHYVGDKAGEFHSVPPPQLSQIDAVGVLLARVPSGGVLDYSYTVRARNAADVYTGSALLQVPPTVNLGAVAPSWISVSPPALTRVVGASAALTIYSDPATTRSTPYLFLGETGYLKLTAQSCSGDGSSAMTRMATVTTADGDSEQLAAVETAPGSNIFLLAPLLTQRAQPQPGSGEVESLRSGTVSVSIEGCFTPVSITFQLIDPSGIVFDSASNAAVDDVDVALFNASGGSCTTTLASVLTTDGSGALVASSNPYRTRNGGRYQFPLVASGTYCLNVASSAAHVFPTTKALSSFPARRVAAGSLGQPFQVGPEPVPVALDLPVDPPAATLDLFVNKKASRDTVLVGEQLQFTVQVKNVSTRSVAHVQLRDAMTKGLSYLPGTVRINDVPAAEPKSAAGLLAIELPDLAPGKTHTVSYRTAVSPSAASSVQNAASATGDQARSNTANVSVEVRRGFETDSKGVLTGTVYLACSADDLNGKPGVPGIRLLLEDGTGVVTDRSGRYSRYGLSSGTHVLKIDPTSLPAHATMAANDREGAAGLAFVDLKDGELFKRNFALECTEEAQEQVKSRAALPVVDEVFKTLGRTFSAAVTVPTAGGASSLSSTGTGVARELPTPGIRDAFGARETNPSADDQSRVGGERAGSAAGSVVPAADMATSLETALLGIADNKAAFINLEQDQVLAVSTIAVQVKAPLDSKLTVSLNDVPLAEGRVGQRSVYRDKSVMGVEYVGVKLRPGSNVLTLEQQDQFGNVRGKASVLVRAPGDLAQISITPVTSPLYAGEGAPSLVRIRMLDAEGVPVTSRLPVTLDTDAGKWLTEEASAARGGGYQLFVEGGQADVAITRPMHATRVAVSATSGKVTSREVLDFLPQLRPFIAAGVAETLIRVKSGQALTVVPTTSLDAFSRELQGLSHQFGGKADASSRLAMFLKGKVKGDYLLTLAYDSDKQTSDRLFRDISPDEFYPIYGDDSTRTFDAQSVSKLYVRIEKGHSWALVGDFLTEPQLSSAPKAVLSSYTRPVNGASTHLEAGPAVVDAFVLRDTTRQQVFEFTPNGTSGPYALPIGNLLANTELVELLVRDRLNPAIILSRTSFTRFDDYELEALSGRVLFKAPLSQFDASQNPVTVRVTFEVQSGQAAFTTFGGQISTKLGESTTIAARVAHEGNPIAPYTVEGLMAQADITPKLKVSAELARTERGTDLGKLSGTAGRVEVKGVAGNVDISASVTATSDNFDNPSSGVSPNRRDLTVVASMPLGEDSKLVGRLTMGKDTKTGALSEVAYAGVETPVTKNVRVEAGLRSLKEETAVFASPDGVPATASTRQQATTVRVKASVQMENMPELTGSAEAEQSLDGTGGREAAVAVNYQLSSGTKLYARHELVNTLPVLSSASTTRQTTAVGVDTAYSTTGRAYAELRETTTQGLSGPAAAYGLRETWELRKGVRFTGGVEKVQTIGGPADLGKTTDSVAITSAVDVNLSQDWRANGRLEHATGPAESSLLATAGLAYKLSPAWTALARQVYYRTQSNTADSTVRIQSRLQLGMAWRSVQDDALLLLERYKEPLDPGDRDSAIVSAQYGRALTTSMRMSARLAGRRSVETSASGSDRSYAALAGGRLSYEIASKWNLGLQGQVVVGNNSRSAGTGLELGYRLTNAFWVVAGYNWMTATDPVLQGPQFSQGAYLRIRYMFDETALDAFPKMGEP
ncbi:MAG: hypothetical protein JWQ33_2348 [Ramlibacter sp.]|nr:hypothetical protein [Ramlibacter sp.]